MGRIPAHIRRRYLTGKCWAMAIAMARETGLELHGLRDRRGDIIHAFVADPALGLGYDIRGRFELSQAAIGSSDPQARIETMTEDDIMKIVGSIDSSDLREARRVLRGYRLAPGKLEKGLDALTDKPNTLIAYEYRDAGNNRVAHVVIFAGRYSGALQDRIDAATVDEEDLSQNHGFFVPGQVGLKDLQMSFAAGPEPLRWYPDDDVWHEMSDIRATNMAPTDPRNIEQFVAELETAVWDADYRPPFHAEMVANYDAWRVRENDNDNNPGL